MAHRSDDIELVRSVGNPPHDEDTSEKNALSVGAEDNGDDDGDGEDEGDEGPAGDLSVVDDEGDLPQCKIKRNYSCTLCPFFSQNPRLFLYHSRDVHFDKIKIFECSQCLYASKHSQKLQRHINMIHVAGKNRLKKNGKSLKVDKKTEEREVKPKLSEPDPLGEDKEIEDKLETDRKIVAETELETNMVMEMEMDVEDVAEEVAASGSYSDLSSILEMEPPVEKTADGEFKCSLCSFKHKREKFLRRHEKVVHLKKRFLRCTKCSYVTHVKARFTKHVKYHSMPMIKCDLCDFRTPYKWNLDRHHKNHCGSGAFQCSKCNFRADIKQSLTVHEMNHHVPPVGQGAPPLRKKNKVGGSDSADADAGEKELLRMEREDSDSGRNSEEKLEEEARKDEKTETESIRNIRLPYVNKRESANNHHLQTDFIHPDDIVPRNGQIYVKNLKCKFCSYKAVFNHEIWRHEKRIHGYVRPEKKRNVAKRPPPKLIPIPPKKSSPVPSPILKIPALKNKTPAQSPEMSPVDKSVNEKEFNEMCKKSCLTSSLKDFVSLIGDEEGLKTIPDSSRGDIEAECSGWLPPEDVLENKTDATQQKQTDLLKKKNASFFDKLKEKLMTGASEEQSLFCEVCGHESKCLSEAVAHQKRHSNANYKSDSDSHQENDIVLSGTELSSTRCQHCRQRCKTSTDLINHLKSCKAFGEANGLQSTSDKVEDSSIENEEKVEDDTKSMENRVFVWNDLGQPHDEEEEGEALEVDIHSNDEYPTDDPPVYGTVTSKGSDNTESGTLILEVDPRLNLTLKKVFKCPHCSFWASTASRFHVHIVGHLNKKPFECSLCLYRSNWRWDITKHIRLKSARDPTHLQAKVNMTDETGRRNYSKYNKFLTMMKVQEPTAESSGTGRRTKPSDITQGNASERDIISLPAPPRLTRAPVREVSLRVLPQGTPLRPPPPLKAAHQVSASVKRDAKEPTKKTLWKCKRCNYRNLSKSCVLAHVKQHYEKKHEILSRSPSGELGEFTETGFASAVSEEDTITSRDLLKVHGRTPTYKCGHCNQESNWKHVIQRHCRLKHNGDAVISVAWKKPRSEENGQGSEPPEDSSGTFSCDICPFTTDSEGDLTAHKLNHIDRPGSIFKCSYCPFYVPSKIAVLEHMEIHGRNCGFDFGNLSVDNFEASESKEPLPKENSVVEPLKKYRCRHCPYLSNSKTQFLYHKQFHRPRNSPFKCLHCSYNVSRRHLLHQHLRVHDGQKPPADEEEGKEITAAMDMPEIPLVWVYKWGNFIKMFKCRWCPHVNVRKINIQDHEKMHKQNEGDDDEEFNVKLHCSDCNYTCNNPGVLASHIKVHQGIYGEIRCLVDPTRSEVDQIRELQKGLVVEKEEAKEEHEMEAATQATTTRNDSLSSQPESAYNQRRGSSENVEAEEKNKVVRFCSKCPARFFFNKEIRIHSKFHTIHLPFRCQYCSYTARQRPHLLAHYKVHTQDYQGKTEELMKSYVVSPDYPKPEIIIVSKESHVLEGPVWSCSPSVPATKERDSSCGKPAPKHSCHRCPAKFFKSVALQYHLSLHGASYQHRCKYCDYTVKTYGNLIKHQVVHEKKRDSKGLKFSYSFPISRSETRSPSDDSDEAIKTEVNEAKKKTDPQFGSLIWGSPDFIYPTYLKNGKMKEKKYKCHKCPSAFEKRDQYRIHLSLHGSRQRYQCEKCDYSVKYYANYVQHMRKHQIHEEAMKLKNLESGITTEETNFDKQPEGSSRENKPLYEMTLLEQQTLTLEERKRSADGKEESKKVHGCRHCPYISPRKDAVENHAKRHFRVSGMKLGFECAHCDYSATQSNFLREHSRLHFGGSSRYIPEAYLKCEKMELWCWEEKAKDNGDSKFLVFRDGGEEEEEEKNRFFPPVDIPDEDIKWRMCVNPETGEPVGEEFQEDLAKPATDAFLTVSNGEYLNDPNEDLIEMVMECEDVAEDIPEIKAKPKVKRFRGKNWKCQKCPHAFGKREQFLRHVSLHGSNQRHSCDICDYSVKFYTNYVQHMRMHQMYEPDRVIYVKKNFQSLEENAMRQKERESISQLEVDESDSCEEKPSMALGYSAAPLEGLPSDPPTAEDAFRGTDRRTQY